MNSCGQALPPWPHLAIQSIHMEYFQSTKNVANIAASSQQYPETVLIVNVPNVEFSWMSLFAWLDWKNHFNSSYCFRPQANHTLCSSNPIFGYANRIRREIFQLFHDPQTPQMDKLRSLNKS
ncbi:hypothetical protein QVD99_002649 [Batrachochytrium dendrobatidis]|nr:hypothetical protein QVD99_002649 [Batrachochytrium dendrobatidis]